MKKILVISLIGFVVFCALYFLLKSNEEYRSNLTQEELEHITTIKEQLKKAKYGDIIQFENKSISVFIGHSGSTIFKFQSCLQCQISQRSYDEWNLIEIHRIIKTTDPDYGEYARDFLMEKSYKSEKSN